MYQIRNKTSPLTFSGSFEKICHGYPTNFSQFNYKIPKTALSKSKCRISFRGPSIRNNFLQNSEKEIESLPFFKSKLKVKLLYFSDEILYFWKYFSCEFATSCWRKGAWWQSHSGFLRVLPHFKNEYESYYLQLEEYLCSVFVCFCNVWRLYEENINIWYIIYNFFSLVNLKNFIFCAYNDC